MSDPDWNSRQQQADRGERDEIMYVDVEGYEGPLDLLLDMARRQKVDLAGISVLALADQYLAFIETIRLRRIEVAADYLVMAAWLAYLKSRLMVPKLPSDDEPSGEMLAALLQFRLKRLEAMREAAAALVNRPRLGREVFARGEPEPIVVARRSVWDVSLFELLKAYASQRQRHVPDEFTPQQRKVWALQDARAILERLLGDGIDWVPLEAYLEQHLGLPEERVTAMASTFSASLELVRQGELELRQTHVFGPLLMRRRSRDRH